MSAVETPRALGYRLPAEWEPHAATWLSWPRPDGISFPGRYDEILPALGCLVRTLAAYEQVAINVLDDGVETLARGAIGDLANVRFQRIPSDEPWCRDHGPLFVTRPAASDRSAVELAVVDWDYNAWGGKYPPFERDDAVPRRMAELLGLPRFRPGIVLEGGSVDVNGAGTLLTTESCLLNRNRNPDLSRREIEMYLQEYLGVTKVLWLGDGIAGDDTDGHIDDLARFVDPRTVVTVVEEDPADENFRALKDNLERLRRMTDQEDQPLRIIELPMPAAVEHDGDRLPASYANFYVANEVVIVPAYADPANDARAVQILQEAFPGRRVVAIDSTALVWGLGSFHCLTQQQPSSAR